MKHSVISGTRRVCSLGIDAGAGGRSSSAAEAVDDCNDFYSVGPAARARSCPPVNHALTLITQRPLPGASVPSSSARSSHAALLKSKWYAPKRCMVDLASCLQCCRTGDVVPITRASVPGWSRATVVLSHPYRTVRITFIPSSAPTTDRNSRPNPLAAPVNTANFYVQLFQWRVLVRNTSGKYGLSFVCCL